MSDELKACPNPECGADERPMPMWAESLRGVGVRVQCLCGVAGPRALLKDYPETRDGPEQAIAEARRLWNALPRVTGPGEATKWAAEFVAGVAKLAPDHRKVWLVVRDGRDLEKTWVLAGALKAFCRECGVRTNV